MGWAFVISMIRLAAASVRIAERQSWMNDQQRRDALAELEAINKALRIKIKVGKQVDAETDQQVFDGLVADGDIRPDERLPG